MTNIRRVSGLMTQGVDEKKRYRFDFANLVAEYGTPSSVSHCKLYIARTGQDVSADKLADSASLSGTVATSKYVQSTEQGITYQLVIGLLFPSGEILDGYLYVKGEL